MVKRYSVEKPFVMSVDGVPTLVEPMFTGTVIADDQDPEIPPLVKGGYLKELYNGFSEQIDPEMVAERKKLPKDGTPSSDYSI